MPKPFAAAIRPVHRAAALLGEGPVWVARDGLLYWIDIHGRRLLAWSPETGLGHEWPVALRLSALAPRAQGGFIAGTDRGIVRFTEASQLESLAELEPHLPGNRCNDGKIDSHGRFWIGTMDDAEQARAGALYRLEADLTWRKMADGCMIPNGPTFSPDGHWLYHTDSADRTIYRFALADDGNLGPREAFLRFDAAHGYPDGMTTDSEGCLWVAFWDGWCIRRFSPDGEHLEEVDLPVQRPTSCAFGGPALDTLFVTSARVGLTEEALARQPDAGSLFACRVRVPGLPSPLFAG